MCFVFGICDLIGSHDLEYVSSMHHPFSISVQVRNPDASWRETRKKLHRDHRWGLAKSLDKAEKEKLFEEQIAILNKKNKEMFHRLLDETVGITLTSTWREVRKLIRSDPRYSRFSSHDRVSLNGETYVDVGFRHSPRHFPLLYCRPT